MASARPWTDPADCEVQQAIAKQIANAQALCASVDAAGLSMRGCPMKTTVDR
jgi:hypothetical protein